MGIGRDANRRGTGLSQDEIVFDEIRFREPMTMRRPDRDRRFACLAYEVPAAHDLPIFLDVRTADAIERHALRDTSVELGGILLGKECVDDQTGEAFVWVTNALEAKHYENTQASFTYTHDSWEEITRERDQKHSGLDIVGWYHTHPDFGVFLSSHDMFIHRNFFGQPLQLAYVVDPIRQTRGFFRWRAGDMEQTGGYYLIGDREDRIALARLANDLENIPNADGAGGAGALSPRLEAELIAMLTRPATQFHGATAADRTQAAMLFGLIGAMLGVIGLAAVLWLSALSSSMSEQARVIGELKRTMSDTTDVQRIALDTALEGAGEINPELFRRNYTKAMAERDRAKTQLENQASINDLLAAKSRKVNEDYQELRATHDELTKYFKNAKEALLVKTRFGDLQAANDAQKQTIAELEELLDTAAGKKAVEAAQKYERAWYAAAAGWAVSAMLGIGLGAGYFYLRYPLEPAFDPPCPASAPGMENSGPHRIS